MLIKTRNLQLRCKMHETVCSTDTVTEASRYKNLLHLACKWHVRHLTSAQKWSVLYFITLGACSSASMSLQFALRESTLDPLVMLLKSSLVDEQASGIVAESSESCFGRNVGSCGQKRWAQVKFLLMKKKRLPVWNRAKTKRTCYITGTPSCCSQFWDISSSIEARTVKLHCLHVP